MPASHLLPIHPGLALVSPTVLLLCTTITADPWHSVRLLLPSASGYVCNSPAIIIINHHPSVSTIVTLPVVPAMPAMPVMSTVLCHACESDTLPVGHWAGSLPGKPAPSSRRPRVGGQ
jgi:hypothetical protein